MYTAPLFFLQTEPTSVTINQINKETQTHHSITAPSPRDLYLDLFVHIILMEAHGVFSFVWGPEIYHVVFCVVVNLLAEGVLLYDNVAICLSSCWWTFGLFSKLGHCWWKDSWSLTCYVHFYTDLWGHGWVRKTGSFCQTLWEWLC